MHKRVLVVFEPGRAGAAALDAARQLGVDEDGQLTVVCVAPHAPSASRCEGPAHAYNDELVDATLADLRAARQQLGDSARTATFALLRDGVDPPLHELAAQGGFDLVLLPARRRPLHSSKHPAANRIRAAGLEVGVVEPGA